MERVYRPLYQLSVLHEFYTSKKSDDFRIVPVSDTAKLIKTNGMVLRLGTDNIKLSYKAVPLSTNPLLPLTEDIKLIFGLTVENPNVFYFTALPPKTSQSDIYYTTGSTSDAGLSFEAKPTRNISFSEVVTLTDAQATFTLLDLEDNKILSLTQTGMQQEEHPTLFDYDFSVQLGNDFQMGLYKIRIEAQGTLVSEESVFILNRVEHNNLIGIIEINIPKTIDHSTAPLATKLNFDALASYWYYHIKLSRNFTNGNFSITDSAVGSSVTFSEISVLPDYSKGQTVVFKSSEEIPKKQLPNSDIQLDVTSDDPNLSLSGLPNPSHHNSQAIIHLKI